MYYVDFRAQIEALSFGQAHSLGMGDGLSRVLAWYDNRLEERGVSPVMIALLQATQHHLRITSFLGIAHFLTPREGRATRATRDCVVMLERSTKAQRFPHAERGTKMHPQFITALLTAVPEMLANPPRHYGAKPPVFPPPPKISPTRRRAQGMGSDAASSSANPLPKLM